MRNITTMVLSIPGILIGITFHEYAHALIATKLGDKTPKFQGRLTLNPMAHIDIVGFIMLLIIGFGWAKPVETNPSAFKHYYKDDLKVSIAGPLTNLITAFIFAMLTGVLYKYGVIGGGIRTVRGILFIIFQLTVQINCMLFIFNFLPLPGLDGFHILRDLFPKEFYKISEFMYNYQLIILAIFVITPLADIIVGNPAFLLSQAFMSMALSI